MHCPGCGAEAAVTQNFCRSCGFDLEKIPQLVAEQSAPILAREETAKLRHRQQKLERSMAVAGAGFGAFVALSFLTGLIYLIVSGSMPLVPGIVLLILLLGGIVAASVVIYLEQLKKKLSKTEALKSKELPEMEAKQFQERFDQPLISVTERTTNLLESNLETANRRKEGGT